jgi:hypothetical protein
MGFFLCTITYTTGAACTSQTYSVNVSTDGSTISYAGDITKGVYLWGNLMVQQTNVSPQPVHRPLRSDWRERDRCRCSKPGWTTRR